MDELQKTSLRLRDTLAVERTKMANERTLMAYLRTSLMLFASGVSLLKLYPGITILQSIGFTLFPVAFLLLILSFVRFQRIQNGILRKCRD